MGAGSSVTQLTFAIHTRTVLEVRFGGDPPGETRLVCPTTIGRKNGRANVVVYQLGPNGLGVDCAQRWRCKPVSEIEVMRALPAVPYKYESPHSRPSDCIDEIEAEVDW